MTESRLDDFDHIAERVRQQLRTFPLKFRELGEGGKLSLILTDDETTALPGPYVGQQPEVFTEQYLIEPVLHGLGYTNPASTEYDRSAFRSQTDDVPTRRKQTSGLSAKTGRPHAGLYPRSQGREQGAEDEASGDQRHPRLYRSERLLQVPSRDGARADGRHRHRWTSLDPVAFTPA
ncbi:hypothetical protein [Haloplanus halophilus]|uniref:hypothetical protein n=1 Tax=Haloplanus halophilus TaxID=2949993 RepID=UPI00203CA46B|nr:hypothetical protein [Haloplanus sp. GDY1]